MAIIVLFSRKQVVLMNMVIVTIFMTASCGIKPPDLGLYFLLGSNSRNQLYT